MKKQRKIRLVSFEEAEKENDFDYWQGKSYQERLAFLYQLNKLCFGLSGIDYDNLKVKRVICLVSFEKTK